MRAKAIIEAAISSAKSEAELLAICNRIVNERDENATLGSLMVQAMAAEREACAMIPEKVLEGRQWQTFVGPHEESLAEEIAAAIRARGQTT